MESIPAYILLLLLVADLVLILILYSGLKIAPKKLPDSGHSNRISVLIAVRNEEKVIVRCIEALMRLDFEGELEFLFGDDQSEDRTASVIRKYAKRDSRIQYHSIHQQLEGMNGKASVLEQLSSYASGDILLFTDADVRLNPKWAARMHANLKKGAALVSGVTVVEGRSMFDRLQNMDWIQAQAMLRVAAGSRNAVTAIGNNMAMDRKVFNTVGGYRSLPFSHTEDHAMCKKLKSNNFPVAQDFHPEAVGHTLPEISLGSWMEQRKRWMKGAFQLPFHIKFLMGIHSFRFLLILILFWYFPVISGCFLAALLGLNIIFLRKASGILGLTPDPNAALLFEFYTGILTPMAFFYYLWPSKVNWKGRKY